MNHKYNDSLTFKIENETDLHTEVVSFLKKRYPYSIFSVGLGENQDSVNKRIDSFKKGYLRGSFDQITHNLLNITLALLLSLNHRADLLLSLNHCADKGFCQVISLRCCNSIKTMASRLSFPMTMTT